MVSPTKCQLKGFCFFRNPFEEVAVRYRVSTFLPVPSSARSVRFGFLRGAKESQVIRKDGPEPWLKRRYVRVSRGYQGGVGFLFTGSKKETHSPEASCSTPGAMSQSPPKNHKLQSKQCDPLALACCLCGIRQALPVGRILWMGEIHFARATHGK